MAQKSSLAEKKLSQAFLARLDEQFNEQDLQSIFRGFEKKRKTVIRINTLKTDLRTVMDILRKHAIHFERVEVLENALILKKETESVFESEKNEELHQMYLDGKIYFQGISSQLPVLFLEPKSTDKILDVSAAPGSKTTQIGLLMKNRGEIVANEIDEIRFQRLQFNAERQGITNICFRLGDGIGLGYEYPEYFDKILLDAPCSAEGRIQFDEARTYRFWSEKNIVKNAKLQRRLFQSAIRSLKPGGTLVYSTCTLAPEENEAIIDWALEKFDGKEEPKITLKPCVHRFQNTLPILKSFQNKQFSFPFEYCVKAAPSEISEGFFIAKFVREK